ncbi:MAG: class I mannose-6-phosphate isomerase [Cytophagaceae bacterium]|nr:class I mannose-6-phosphate isomerase [Cytophagaceae bacterium]
MTALYPLKFKTIFKDKIWGGNKIKTILGKDFSPLPNCGETWEISGVKGNESIVADGSLAGKSLPDLIDEYKGKLVGESLYKKFGNEFPLLIKFIDANDDLSIQVHPDDALAKKRHNSFGKTEMWYIFQADKGATLNSGFSKKVDKETYLKHLNNNTLDEILNFEKVEVGDVYFLPAGRVHYIGKGVCLAEIQQTSDITYRIYDFDRADDKGQKRELHTELAVDAIDYNFYPEYKSKYTPRANEAVKIVSCQYFTTNLIDFDRELVRDYSSLDSFVIYICVEGAVKLSYNNSSYSFKKGDSILLPAEIKNVKLTPAGKTKLLEASVQ